MVFQESPLKDLYRKLIWGPYRKSFRLSPPATELRANRRLGQLAGLASQGKRDALCVNLRRAFPDASEEELAGIARRLFETHFVDQYISWSFARVSSENWTDYLEFSGREHLDQALEEGKGAVLMHPHMGPAQLPLCVLGVLGYRMNQIGGGGVEGELSEAGKRATATRHRLEQEHLPVSLWDGGSFIRPVLRALKQGEVVMTAMDGTGGGKELGRRVEREVLGQRMRVPVGPVYLAWRSEAPLLTLHTTYQSGSQARYRTTISEPLPLERTGPRKQVLEQGADLIAERLTRLLRQHPGDWHFWDEFRPGSFLCEEEQA